LSSFNLFKERKKKSIVKREAKQAEKNTLNWKACEHR